MRLNTLSPAEGSKKAGKRLGRGIGSGLGKTGGRGHKGQKSRSGGGVRRGFEGGQMPLYRRLPKRGFHNNFMKVYSVVNIEALNRFENGTVITAELLKAEGIISKIEKDGLKVLGRGELTQRLTVKAAKVSNSAREAIVAVGGTVEVPNV